MNDPKEQARERAESLFKRRARLKSEGEQAWTEYLAEQKATERKTARLRAQRLAREKTQNPRTQKALPSLNRSTPSR